MSVIDIRTRKAIEIREPTDEEKVQQFVEFCQDRLWVDAAKIRAIAGLDAALRALGKVADSLRNQGRE